MALMGTTIITEPANKAIIRTTVESSSKLDAYVYWIINEKEQDYFYFELISNDPTTHDGTSARIVECVYQEEQEDSRYRSSELFMIIDDWCYRIELKATLPIDYDSYSRLFQKVMAGFHVP